MNEAKPPEPTPTPSESTWDQVIQPKASYLILGDVGTGKSAMAYWLMERYSERYNLTPVVVGIPPDKVSLLPKSFKVLARPDELTGQENVIAYIDEADIQLAIEDTKARRYVTNFLSLPRQRHQLLLLTFHYPRLVLARYLPFFAAFLHKRPPYLIEFASKSKGDSLYQMMMKAEERFAELVAPDWKPTEQQPQPIEVIRHTYVVAPRIRWQGMLENPLASFWSQDLSEVWAGTEIDQPTGLFEPAKGLVSLDGQSITPEMQQRGVEIEKVNSPPPNRVMLDPFTNTRWVQ